MILGLNLAICGCVERRFVIEANVPNAQVYVNEQPIGAAPAHLPFEYYGYYTITLSHPGYETLRQRVHVVAPWYAYPPFDFLAEVLCPFPIRDVRRYYFELQPARQPNRDELLQRAEQLRQQGQTLPLPPRAATPHHVNPDTSAPAPLPSPNMDPLIPPVGPVPPSS
jgi:hypothetical protein